MAQGRTDAESHAAIAIGPDGQATVPVSETPSISQVAARVAAERTVLEHELSEIALLVGQAIEETERHEGRRAKGEERVRALEKESHPDLADLRDATTQLVALTRRKMLFDAQREVLEGKQKTLTRYRDSLVRLSAELGNGTPPAETAGSDGATTSTSTSSASAPNAVRSAAARREGTGADSATVLRAQEDLRRDIARQMHDGPAQSLANIALQSEIVERLVARGDKRAPVELEAMRRMVQSTLAATKDFIFDVRPMVLDDLGLVPTLRRTAVDRGQRAGLEIDFDSLGSDRRLGPDLESSLFRILDDIISGYLTLRPARITVRLDWSQRELSATVRGHWPTSAAAAKRRDVQLSSDMPPALAAMIEENDREERQAQVDAHSIAEPRMAELRERAAILGVALTVLDDGQATEIIAPLS